MKLTNNCLTIFDVDSGFVLAQKEILEPRKWEILEFYVGFYGRLCVTVKKGETK